MSQETSVVVKKLQNYFETGQIESFQLEKPVAKKSEPGILSSLLAVCLMSTAIALTKLTLIITRWVKKLES